MSTRHPNLVGEQFDRLTVVRMLPDRDKSGNVMWECACSCGAVSVVRTNGLRAGAIRSCGCYGKEQRLNANRGNTYRRYAYGDSAANNLFSHYRIDAAKRGISFELSIDDFKNITKGDCFYCGKPPDKVRKASGAYGTYQYNGIDRVINHLGYVSGNCVSCCTACNSKKGGVSLEMVIKIYDFVFNRHRGITPSPQVFDGAIQL